MKPLSDFSQRNVALATAWWGHNESWGLKVLWQGHLHFTSILSCPQTKLNSQSRKSLLRHIYGISFFTLGPCLCLWAYVDEIMGSCSLSWYIWRFSHCLASRLGLDIYSNSPSQFHVTHKQTDVASEIANCHDSYGGQNNRFEKMIIFRYSRRAPTDLLRMCRFFLSNRGPQLTLLRKYFFLVQYGAPTDPLLRKCWFFPSKRTWSKS